MNNEQKAGKRIAKAVLFPAILILLAACSARDGEPRDFMDRFGLEPEPAVEGFSVCTSFACESSVVISLTDDEKRRLGEIFEPEPDNAAEERARIALAVGLMERMIGPRVGTANDAPKNTWIKGKQTEQLDCVAEAANTTTYLMIMKSMGRIGFHEVVHPARRGVIPFTAHNTAVIRDVEFRREYAVDSWYGANGEPAHIAPLPLWLDGWDPEGD